MKKAINILSINEFVDFHQELTELLNKYNLHDNGNLVLKTSVTTIKTNIVNCKPGCVVYGRYKDENGKEQIGYYCAC